MDNNHKERVEFPAPEGFSAPEHEGDEFDLVCTFRTKANGELCLVQLGDHKMEGYSDKEDMKKDDKPGYSSMANNLMSQDVPNAGAGY